MNLLILCPKQNIVLIQEIFIGMQTMDVLNLNVSFCYLFKDALFSLI